MKTTFSKMSKPEYAGDESSASIFFDGIEVGELVAEREDMGYSGRDYKVYQYRVFFYETAHHALGRLPEDRTFMVNREFAGRRTGGHETARKALKAARDYCRAQVK